MEIASNAGNPAAFTRSASAMFPSTLWTLVGAVRQDSSESGAALEKLCRRYWRPVYAWIRRSGKSPTDAEDFTQAFFLHVLARRTIERAERERGRFRAFIITVLKRFLADQWDHASAQRRGGGVIPFSLDVASAEADEALGAAGGVSPERAFDRRWALDVLAQARGRLREECAAARKLEIFDVLFAEEVVETQAALAQRLGTTENTVKMTARRLRQRLEELVRTVVGETVSSYEDLDNEIRHLMNAVSA